MSVKYSIEMPDNCSADFWKIFTSEFDAVLISRKHSIDGYGGNKISIGIIEENAKLKDWYLKLGFNHISTRKFKHLPFTVGFMEMEM